MEYLSLILSFLSIVIMPIVLWKLDKKEKYDKRIGKEKLDIEEADNKITKHHRLMSRETARTVIKVKPNDELSKAIENFDIAYDELEEQKEKAIQNLRNEYK